MTPSLQSILKEISDRAEKATDGCFESQCQVTEEDVPRLVKALEYFVSGVRKSGDEGDTNVWDPECEQLTKILEGTDAIISEEEDQSKDDCGKGEG